MDRKNILFAAAAAVVAAMLFDCWLWQPERQVRLHTAHFLKAIEGRRPDRALTFIAANYSDRWNHDKEIVVRESNEVFQQFLFLTIQNETLSCAVSGPVATNRTRIKITGRGSPIAEIVMDRVNSLREPFVFTWERKSWKPWEWQLIQVDQPELHLDDRGEF